jgi:enoyl-CoA hydratase/carnithine racemase
MYEVLARTLAEASADQAVRVVVFAGNEQIFCAGNDLGDFVENPPVTSDAPVWQFLRALAAFPKPVIAAVCGAAVGIGTTMLLHCDLVFSSDNARFSLPFVNLGLCPEAASSLLLPKLAGYQRAAEALLLGEPFDAQAALAMGLVNRILPAHEVLAHARAQADKLVAKALSAVIAAKSLLKAGERLAIQQRMTEEAEIFGRMVSGAAAREAIAAFSEKRKPDFSKF